MKRKWLFCAGIGLMMLLFSCSPRQHVLLRKNYSIDSVIHTDSSSYFAQTIREYKKKLEAQMQEVVGNSSQYMPSERPESLLSNLVADLTLSLGKEYCKKRGLKHGVDASIINIRGLRKAMPQGEITLGDIYEISPFENKLYIVGMYGKDLRKLFDHITRGGGEGVGSIRLVADKETKKLREAFVDGKPLENSRLYYIISIDYLINGGDGMAAFGNRVSEIDIDMKSRDALLNYVKEQHQAGKALTSKTDWRITYE